MSRIRYPNTCSGSSVRVVWCSTDPTCARRAPSTNRWLSWSFRPPKTKKREVTQMADEKPNLREAGEKDAKARDQALQAAVKQIEQNFGQGALMKLGDQGALKVESVSTGALPLDIALGVGGVPRGRIVEIFGPESSGKTTLIYHIVAEAQARGGVCAFIDT